MQMLKIHLAKGNISLYTYRFSRNYTKVIPTLKKIIKLIIERNRTKMQSYRGWLSLPPISLKIG
jgi:hypothetical protein